MPFLVLNCWCKGMVSQVDKGFLSSLIHSFCGKERSFLSIRVFTIWSLTDPNISWFSCFFLLHFQTYKAFLPAMIANNHGHLVSIASSAGLIGVNGLAGLCFFMQFSKKQWRLGSPYICLNPQTFRVNSFCVLFTSLISLLLWKKQKLLQLYQYIYIWCDATKTWRNFAKQARPL